MSQIIKEYLNDSINELTKECNKLIHEVNKLKVEIENIHKEIDYLEFVKTLDNNKKVKEKVDLLDFRNKLLKLKELELNKNIDSLANKRANLSWIEDIED